jgi:PPM family protein phosphatase
VRAGSLAEGRGDELRVETAEVSLLGDREDNQDRAAIERRPGGVLLVVADGMGGHAGGALAAETAVRSLCQTFAAAQPDVDGRQLLQGAMESAHDKVVGVGENFGVGSRPRATCAACVVRDGIATWAHVGDSRVYLARGGAIVTRTRDHTPIESLLQDGLITEDEIPGHPMRHYVEYCLGGLAERPVITVSEPTPLLAGDVVLLCSDGLWSGVQEEDLAAEPGEGRSLQEWLACLAAQAVRYSAPHSDNTTAVAIRSLAN